MFALVFTLVFNLRSQMASAEADGGDDAAADDAAGSAKTDGESSSGVKALFPLGKRVPVRCGAAPLVPCHAALRARQPPRSPG